MKAYDVMNENLIMKVKPSRQGSGSRHGTIILASQAGYPRAKSSGFQNEYSK